MCTVPDRQICHAESSTVNLFVFRRLLQLDGDLGDIEPALGRQVLRKGARLGHCSGLVKLFPGNMDLAISQVTWNDYQSMLRVFKLYDVNIHLQNSKGEMTGLT